MNPFKNAPATKQFLEGMQQPMQQAPPQFGQPQPIAPQQQPMQIPQQFGQPQPIAPQQQPMQVPQQFAVPLPQSQIVKSTALSDKIRFLQQQRDQGGTELIEKLAEEENVEAVALMSLRELIGVLEKVSDRSHIEAGFLAAFLEAGGCFHTHSKGFVFGDRTLFPQTEINEGLFHYFVDFTFVRTHRNRVVWKIAIECDGKERHSSPEDLSCDHERDRQLQMMGYRVLRFTGTFLTQFAKEAVVRVLEFADYLDRK